MLTPTRIPQSSDWIQVFVNFDPIWAVTLVYNDEAARTIAGMRHDVTLWAQRMQHRIYSRNHSLKPRLCFLGWAEKVKSAPHVHLAVKPPTGHFDLRRINKWMAREWCRRPNVFRHADVQWIADAGGWGSYISKEINLLSVDTDHLIAS